MVGRPPVRMPWMSLILLLALAGCGADTPSRVESPPGSPVQDPVLAQLERIIEDAPSSAVLRATAHRVIDGYSALLKRQIDALVDQWERLSPEEQRQVRNTIKTLIRAAWPRVSGDGSPRAQGGT